MAAHAELEPLAGVIRVWDHSGGYGDPYDFACTFRMLDRTTIELMGVTHAPTRDQVTAMLEACAHLGIEQVQIHRIKDGQSVKKLHCPTSRR